MLRKICLHFAIALLPGISPVAAQQVKKQTGPASPKNWYEKSFFLLHIDYHTKETDTVGHGVDFSETLRLINLAKPDVIQIHAKGNPGYTTYPSKVGHTPPLLTQDVLQIWKNAADSGGYKFSVYFNLGRDAKIMKDHPAWNRIGANGVLADRSLCFQSGVLEGYLLPMIGEIMERYHPAGFWFDGTCFSNSVCYCDKCKERFKKETGLDAPKTYEEKGWDTFKDMHRQIYREAIATVSNYVKQHDKNCLVAVNVAYSFLMPEEPGTEVDYLTLDFGNNLPKLPIESALHDAKGKPFDMMTWINYDDSTGRHLKPREQVEQEIAAVISNGARYFVWDNPERTGALVPNRIEFSSTVVAPFLRSRQQWCMDTKPVPEVSLLHGAASHYAINRNLEFCFPWENPPVFGANLTLRQLHICHEIITESQLDKLAVNGKLLIVENPLALTASNKTALYKFVEKGGQLLITGQAALLPELNKLTGIKLSAATNQWSNISLNANNQLLTFKRQIPVVKTMKAMPMATGNTENGTTTLLFKNHFGKGIVYSISFPLFSNDAQNQLPLAVKDWYMQQIYPETSRTLTTTAQPETEIVLRKNKTQYIIHMVNMGKGQRRTVGNNGVHISNIPPAASTNISVKMSYKPSSITVQPLNKAITDFTYTNGTLSMKVPGFDIHQMIVIE